MLGKVVKGTEVIDKIASLPLNTNEVYIRSKRVPSSSLPTSSSTSSSSSSSSSEGVIVPNIPGLLTPHPISRRVVFVDCGLVTPVIYKHDPTEEEKIKINNQLKLKHQEALQKYGIVQEPRSIKK